MNPDELEQRIARQTIRSIPVEWRKEILAAAQAPSPAAQASRPTPSFFSTVNARLSALLWPCPQAWAGLAAVWIVILAVNFSSEEKPATMARNSLPASPDAIIVWREQQRMFAKLIEPWDEPIAEPPKRFVPKPRGDIPNPIMCV